MLRQPPLTLLTGDGYAPFSARDLPEGGMFPDLIRRAAGHARDPIPYEIHVVPDWRLHLTSLLPDGVYDMGFPWFRPDCSKTARLSAFMADRCQSYSFSKPFYEAIIGYYTRSEGPFSRARTHVDLAGARLCRPYGYFRFDLDGLGLKPPTVEIIQPATLSECFQALGDGRVDIVSIGVSDAAGVIQRLGLRRSVRELSRLAAVQSLHVMVPRNNPRARRGLAMLDDGIEQMRASGEWYRVVSRHMNDFARRTAQR